MPFSHEPKTNPVPIVNFLLRRILRHQDFKMLGLDNQVLIS